MAESADIKSPLEIAAAQGRRVLTASPPEGVFDHPLYKLISRPPGPQDKRDFKIRPAKISDGWKIALVEGRAFQGSTLTEILSPHHRQYPCDFVYGFYSRNKTKMLSPLNRSFVAVPVDEAGREAKEGPIGWVMCERLGEDEGAKAVEKEKSSLCLTIYAWLWGKYLKIRTYFFPDRSSCPIGLAGFLQHGEEESEKHFDTKPELENRWYTQSIGVAPEWRQRGVGKALMREVIALAEKENLPISLESSAMGDALYRSVGFTLLDRFMTAYGEEEVEKGGIFMWTPPKKILEDEELVEEIAASGDVAVI